MEWPQVREMPLSVRVFAGLLLCVAALGYLTFLGSIWIDTGMRIGNVIEGYGSFEAIELTHHSFKYIFWFMGTFAVADLVFLLTSWPERLKRFFAVSAPLLIVSDIGSMWLIRYSSFLRGSFTSPD